MKFALSGLGFILLAVATPAARYDYVWPGHGIITFDVPFSWSLMGSQAGDVGFNFKAVPKSGAAAIRQVSLVELPVDKPAQPGGLKARRRGRHACLL